MSAPVVIDVPDDAPRIYADEFVDPDPTPPHGIERPEVEE